MQAKTTIYGGAFVYMRQMLEKFASLTYSSRDYSRISPGISPGIHPKILLGFLCNILLNMQSMLRVALVVTMGHMNKK